MITAIFILIGIIALDVLLRFILIVLKSRQLSKFKKIAEGQAETIRVLKVLEGFKKEEIEQLIAQMKKKQDGSTKH